MMLSPRQSPKRKRNLFFDLNGTLILRSQTEQHFKGEKKLKQRYITLRPGIIPVLAKLKEFYNFYIYSSMTKANIQETISEFFRGVEFVEIFDREWNKRDPKGVNQWDTIRDMEKIWEYLKEKGIDDTNTIIIENEARKVEEIKSNAIIVQSISPVELRNNSTEVADHLCDYLFKIAEEKGDVKKILEKHPYVNDNLVKELEKIGISPESKITKAVLDISYVNEKEICLTNFPMGLIIKVKLPLKAGIQIDRQIPYSFLVLNKVAFELSFSN